MIDKLNIFALSEVCLVLYRKYNRDLVDIIFVQLDTVECLT